MNDPVLVDTGPIVAILSSSEDHHQTCVEQLRRIRGPLVTCWPVITEAAWLLRAYPRQVRLLLSSCGGAPYHLASLDEADMSGIASILGKYEDLGIQLADAAIMHLANREGIGTIFTLDRRDFSVMRLPKGRKPVLIP